MDTPLKKLGFNEISISMIIDILYNLKANIIEVDEKIYFEFISTKLSYEITPLEEDMQYMMRRYDYIYCEFEIFMVYLYALRAIQRDNGYFNKQTKKILTNVKSLDITSRISLDEMFRSYTCRQIEKIKIDMALLSEKQELLSMRIIKKSSCVIL